MYNQICELMPNLLNRLSINHIDTLRSHAYFDIFLSFSAARQACDSKPKKYMIEIPASSGRLLL